MACSQNYRTVAEIGFLRWVLVLIKSVPFENGVILKKSWFLILLLILSPVNIFAGEKTEQFPLTREVAKVWEWQQVNEFSPSGRPYDFFAVRYHRAPAGSEKFGPYGLSAYLKDAPELGVLLAVWGIGKNPDGNYNFESATFAHRLENDFWFVADPGFIISAGPGFKDIVSVVVYRRVVGPNPKIAGREKVVAEYRVRYSTKTLTSVIFKIMDPKDTTREIYYFQLELSKTPMGEKTIEKEERE